MQFSKNQLVALAIIIGIVASVFWRISVVGMAPHFALAAIPCTTYPCSGSQLVITSISPTNKLVGAADFLLTVNGSGFGVNPKIVFNGFEKNTTVVSTTKLRTTITSAEVAIAGVVSVQFRSGGGTSNSASFTINNPAPRITDIDPVVGVLDANGDANFTLTVEGRNFVPGSVINMNGVPIMETSTTNTITEYISSTELRVQINSRFVPGRRNITVTNPNPGGGASNSKVLTLQNPLPVLDSAEFGIGQTSIIGGSPQTLMGTPTGATMIIRGSNFLQNSTVKLDASVTLYPFSWSSTELVVVIPSRYLSLARVGDHVVKVFNPGPGGGLSVSGFSFQVENPEPTITSVTPDIIAIGSPDTVIIVEGTGFIAESDIVVEGPPSMTLDTRRIAPNKLRAIIPASFFGSDRVYNIFVNTPSDLGPGGGASENVVLRVKPTILSIVKNTNGGDGTFNFTVGSGAQVGSVNITTSSQEGDYTTSVFPGTRYSVRENVPAGWLLTSKSCSINGVPTGAQNASNNGLTNIAVIAGRTTTCTFNNEKVQPVPIISRISPTSMLIPGQEDNIVIKVYGRNFTGNSKIRIDGSNIEETLFLLDPLINERYLFAEVPVSEFDTAGIYDISVFTPTPGGGVSTSLPFLVTAAP